MEPSNMDMVEVDLGGHTVMVPKGGLYDRYRMNRTSMNWRRTLASVALTFSGNCPKQRWIRRSARR